MTLEDTVNDSKLKRAYTTLRNVLGMVDEYRPAAGIFVTTRILDGLSTYLMVDALGSSVEKMPLAKQWIDQFGTDYGLLLHQGIGSGAVLLLAYAIDKLTERKPDQKLLQQISGARILNALSMVGLAIVTNNVINYYRALANNTL